MVFRQSWQHHPPAPRATNRSRVASTYRRGLQQVTIKHPSNKMKTTYTNEQLQEAIDEAFHESSGDDGFWLGIARAFLDNLPEPLVTKSYSSPEWTPQAGDVVRLKSGGPLMTVGCPIEHTIPSVSCAWFDGATLCSTPIPTACIELSTKEDAQ